MWYSKAKYQRSYLTFLSLIFLASTTINANAAQLCSMLTLPEHGFFFSGYCERDFASLCGVGCLTGYRIIDGDSFRECQQGGTWTGKQLKCEEIRCSPLKMSTQTTQECSPTQNTSSFIVGTKCRVKCSVTGHRLIGPSTRECLSLGIWSGYQQFCIVSTETTTTTITKIKTTTTATTINKLSTTTIRRFRDYSNFALSINKNDTGIVVPLVQPSQFTIIFWFYLNNGANVSLISLREDDDKKLFEIIVRENRLVFYYLSRNQTQPTLIKIPNSKWNHFAWMYSKKTQQSYLYIDGTRQQSFDFKITNLNFDNVSSLILFHRTFHGLMTRLEIWKEMISEQQVLISYRDCRKQNGDVFSWSKISDQLSFDTNKLKTSSFCSGCSEPASISGGIYNVSDYEIGSFVEYKCNYGYEMIGSDRIYCMVPSEWYPLAPICQHNPCTSNCEQCDQKSGVCLRQQTKLDFPSTECDPPCDDDEECIDGECAWSNLSDKWMLTTDDTICNPPCPLGARCINRRCEPNMMPSCSVPCRPGQLCIDSRCGCYKGLCENGRDCFEICDIGENCHNRSCSCGVRGKCGKGEICLSDVCMCGIRRGGCPLQESCVNGKCIRKTNQCNNTCKSNEICVDEKCVCKEQCEKKVFCPFPCLNGGRCTGFYQCTCRQDWQGHRCEQRQRKNITLS
ncbi:unnamed protein product [Rotaria magnacalcarata]